MDSQWDRKFLFHNPPEQPHQEYLEHNKHNNNLTRFQLITCYYITTDQWPQQVLNSIHLDWSLYLKHDVSCLYWTCHCLSMWKIHKWYTDAIVQDQNTYQWSTGFQSNTGPLELAWHRCVCEWQLGLHQLGEVGHTHPRRGRGEGDGSVEWAN